MKGIVEIYGTTEEGRKDLLYSDDNMTTVGFSENIVDMLTTPSSIQYPTALNSAALDSSNYTIQAFSMSKGKDQFKTNQHAYSTDNLLHNSDLDDTSGWTLTNVTLTKNSVEGDTFNSSGHLLNADTSSGSLSQAILYDGTDGAFGAPYFSGTDFVFGVDVKLNRGDPPVQVSGTTNEYIGYSQIALSSCNNLFQTSIKWDNRGVAVLDDTVGWTSSLAGIKDIGGGWYRVFVHGLYASGGSTHPTTAYIYPSVGESADALVDTTTYPVTGGAGSIYINRPQLELGTHPTNYVKTSSFLTRDNTLAYSRLNSTAPYGTFTDAEGDKVAFKYYVVSGSGGQTLSGLYGSSVSDLGVSAYIPNPTTLIPAAHPEDTELTLGAITPVEEAFGVQITKGQNSAVQNLGDSLYVSSFDSSWSYSSKYTPVFGRHLSYVGTFGVSSDVLSSGVSATAPAASLVYFVSAYDENGLANPLSSTPLYQGICQGSNIRCSMDAYGYWIMHRNGESYLPTDYSFGGPQNKCVVEAELDFSSTGEIQYHMRMVNMSGHDAIGWVVYGGHNSDSVLLNIFGGVNVIGLWGLDLKKIKEDNIGAFPPYLAKFQHQRLLQGGTAYPTRRYKLYSKKVLTDNIMKNEGLGTSAGIFGDYLNLDLYWKVKFI